MPGHVGVAEIETLRTRIKNLEAELDTCKTQDGGLSRALLPTPADSNGETCSTSASPPEETDSRLVLRQRTSSPRWEGIYVTGLCSDQRYYYGPASSYYFISRMGAYLTNTFQQPIADRSMQPQGTVKSLAAPIAREQDLSRLQEEYFLNLFWDSYHVTVPVVNEEDFRKHYETLWSAGNTRRSPSPLVEIVLALCLQYGYSFVTQSKGVTGTDHESTISGRRYYKRCQALLSTELENPSLVAVQCQIFSVIYLCCASFQNMSQIMLSSLIRTAQIIGLHMDPPNSLPESERELRKRIWWTVSLIEAKMTMKLGRPKLLDMSDMTVSYAKDDALTASEAGSRMTPFGQDVTWLSYGHYLCQLVHTTTVVYHPAWDSYRRILHQRNLNTPYEDLEALEACAEQLTLKISPLKSWTETVPTALHLPRRDGSRSFATSSQHLDLDTFAPAWLQRSRVILELTYHTMHIGLYRPFISFSSCSTTYTPHASQHAKSAVQHAIAHTHIMYTVVSETDLMNGWNEYFLWQWNATVTIIGFLLAYPVHPSAQNAHRALEKCISICDTYGENFAVARSASSIATDLVARADALMSRIRNDEVCEEVNSSATQGQENATGTDEWNLSTGNEDPGSWADFMDWALTVDTFNSFEDFYGGTDWDWSHDGTTSREMAL
ncbi:fungal specific transcription factor domain-containing protein [Sarocladium implicatum]|nr:fungal specific transcription factor domain-containing protein [Sarocladium implicatum]